VRVDRLAAEGRVDVTWLPYELDPSVPREGAPMPERIRGAWGHVEAMAADVGLVMRRSVRRINSRLALSTAEFARERGKSDEVRIALTKAHWEGTADLGRVEDLKRIAADAGLDPAELERALAEGRYEALLDRHRADATAVGINAIPAHILGRRYLLLGAQPYEAFIEVLDQLDAERAQERGPV
jgi:predicted DsbA family dithiol-disulfide isomerase